MAYCDDPENDDTIEGYSNHISDQLIYVRIYDKIDNLLRTVSCNQATGDYDTGTFSAPAGKITFEITPVATAVKTY